MALELKDVPLFKGLPEKELGVIAQRLIEKSYKPGDILFREGNRCEQIVILRTGRVKVFRMSSAGRQQILETLTAGDTCACNPGASEWFCSSTAEAVTPTSVWILSRSNYKALIDSQSRLSHTLNQLFAERLCRFSCLIEDIALHDVKKRLVRFLLEMHDNSVAKSTKSNVIFIPFTREEIAQRIGSVRETVARYLTQLKDAGLIDIKPCQIIICDKSGLKKILE